MRVEVQFSHGIGSRTFQNNSSNANGYFEICLSCSADYPLPRLGLYLAVLKILFHLWSLENNHAKYDL